MSLLEDTAIFLSSRHSLLRWDEISESVKDSWRREAIKLHKFQSERGVVVKDENQSIPFKLPDGRRYPILHEVLGRMRKEAGFVKVLPLPVGECASCEYAGKCDNDPQKADYCPKNTVRKE